MTVNENLKDISNVDLKSWAQYAHLGSIGIIFFSEDFEKLNSDLLSFFERCYSTTDSVVILTPEGVLSEENKKIIALLPFVHFFYSNDNFLEFIEKVDCHHFLKRKDQKIPDSLEEAISKLETCQVHEF